MLVGHVPAPCVQEIQISRPIAKRLAKCSKAEQAPPPVSKEIRIRPVGMMGIEPEFEYSRLVVCISVYAISFPFLGTGFRMNNTEPAVLYGVCFRVT